MEQTPSTATGTSGAPHQTPVVLTYATKVSPGSTSSTTGRLRVFFSNKKRVCFSESNCDWMMGTALGWTWTDVRTYRIGSGQTLRTAGSRQWTQPYPSPTAVPHCAAPRPRTPQTRVSRQLRQLYTRFALSCLLLQYGPRTKCTRNHMPKSRIRGS